MLHQELLIAYANLLLATQHPNAPPAVGRFGSRYSIVGRLWTHGIIEFLGIIKSQLPRSLIQARSYIYFANRVVGVLLERATSFEFTWLECLGDLSRTNVDIGYHDEDTRTLWSKNYNFWYHQASATCPEQGRIYQHIAGVQPSKIHKLGNIARSVSSTIPYLSARDIVTSMLTDDFGGSSNVERAFIKLHVALLLVDKDDELVRRHELYTEEMHQDLSLSKESLGPPSSFSALANIAAKLKYGRKTSILRRLFDLENVNDDSYDDSFTDTVAFFGLAVPEAEENTKPSYSFKVANRIFTDTLAAFIKAFSPNAPTSEYPGYMTHLHISLVFLKSLVSLTAECFNVQAIVELLRDAPWRDICDCLNTLAVSVDTDNAFTMRCIYESLAIQDNGRQASPLPEDYLIRGQVWSANYYLPKEWFGKVVDLEDWDQETDQTSSRRKERLLWLVVRIADC
ncbi:MAG: hypothetical protein MMC23_001701 [Stictis urceolatum]|nr:hypothetical protein [Stictis urceolata]